MQLMTESFKQGIILGYNFASRVMMQMYDINEPAVDMIEKESQILRKIVDGDFTLFNSPNEKIAKFPNMNKDFAEHLRKSTGKLIEIDKFVANVIMNRF